jgi:hypothetical protein
MDHSSFASVGTDAKEIPPCGHNGLGELNRSRPPCFPGHTAAPRRGPPGASFGSGASSECQSKDSYPTIRSPLRSGTTS